MLPVGSRTGGLGATATLSWSGLGN
jgi:hypothetical protein